jgi:hypothetical protein
VQVISAPGSIPGFPLYLTKQIFFKLMKQLQKAFANVNQTAKSQGVCPILVVFNGLCFVDTEVKRFEREKAVKAQAKRGGKYKAPPKFTGIFNF